ncbi:uncharacterized protein BJ171DRAFT_493219 [Polychytrium aggregatum]|uniref:uncharacterized protein n=1 Tax=Polychytrium aggregatum TaxID=110093 RepID=UPI0022FE5D28|nr:uncharacterized protein BJ171DRAFT_493219 [Polychytrium aggregatum]KAI9207608.1 hypothetical protein BJ171DRAFT_493219 [Polychytrium aggregatum]
MSQIKDKPAATAGKKRGRPRTCDRAVFCTHKLPVIASTGRNRKVLLPRPTQPAPAAVTASTSASSLATASNGTANGASVAPLDVGQLATLGPRLAPKPPETSQPPEQQPVHQHGSHDFYFFYPNYVDPSLSVYPYYPALAAPLQPVAASHSPDTLQQAIVSVPQHHHHHHHHHDHGYQHPPLHNQLDHNLVCLDHLDSCALTQTPAAMAATHAYEGQSSLDSLFAPIAQSMEGSVGSLSPVNCDGDALHIDFQDFCLLQGNGACPDGSSPLPEHPHIRRMHVDCCHDQFSNPDDPGHLRDVLAEIFYSDIWPCELEADSFAAVAADQTHPSAPDCSVSVCSSPAAQQHPGLIFDHQQPRSSPDCSDAMGGDGQPVGSLLAHVEPAVDAECSQSNPMAPMTKQERRRMQNCISSRKFRVKQRNIEEQRQCEIHQHSGIIQDLERRITEYKMEVEWLRRLISDGVTSAKLQDIYRENGIEFSGTDTD